jgi:hypothetical protein
MDLSYLRKRTDHTKSQLEHASTIPAGQHKAREYLCAIVLIEDNIGIAIDRNMQAELYYQVDNLRLALSTADAWLVELARTIPA